MITHFSPSVLEPLAAIVEMRTDHGPLEGMYSPKRGVLASDVLYGVHTAMGSDTGAEWAYKARRCAQVPKCPHRWLGYLIFDLRGKSGTTEGSFEQPAVYSRQVCKTGISRDPVLRTAYERSTYFVIQQPTPSSGTIHNCPWARR